MSQTQAAPLLEVTNLTKHFPVTAGFLVTREIGRVRAVDDVSFHIGRGETLGLVGESGCGKSTLAALLLRFRDPDAGRITVGGTDIRSIARGRLRARIATVLQPPFL